MDEKVLKKMRSMSQEDAAYLLKDIISNALQEKSYFKTPTSHNSDVEQSLPNSNERENYFKNSIVSLSKKQKNELLKKAQIDAVIGEKNSVILFCATKFGYYHDLMYESNRAKEIRKAYSELTKRTKMHKQKLFLEHVGLCHHMNKTEYSYYTHRYRRCKSLLRQGLYDFETKKFYDPLFQKNEMAESNS